MTYSKRCIIFTNIFFSFFCTMKFFLLRIIVVTFSSKSLSENYNLKKIVTLDDPWGSSFINNTELIITLTF